MTESVTVALLKGGAKKTKTKTKAIPEMDFIQQTVNIIENLDAKAALKKASEIVEESGHTSFALGGVLDAIYTNGWYDGYDSFIDYIEGEFGMKIRKAKYLMKIYNDLVGSEIPWEKVAKLGWTKLSRLSGYLTVENVDEWVKRAKSMSVKQLTEYIRKMNEGEINESGDITEEGDETSDGTTVTVSFHLHSDQKETILQAVDTAKEAADTQYDAVALEMICLDYMGGEHTPAEKTTPIPVSLEELFKGKTIEEVLGAVEASFPEVEITAMVP